MSSLTAFPSDVMSERTWGRLGELWHSRRFGQDRPADGPHAAGERHETVDMRSKAEIQGFCRTSARIRRLFPEGRRLHDRDVLLGEQCGSNPHGEGSTPSVLAPCVRGRTAQAPPSHGGDAGATPAGHSRGPVTQRVWRPACRAGETGSSPVQGARVRAGDWAVRQPSDTRS